MLWRHKLERLYKVVRVHNKITSVNRIAIRTSAIAVSDVIAPFRIDRVVDCPHQDQRALSMRHH